MTDEDFTDAMQPWHELLARCDVETVPQERIPLVFAEIDRQYDLLAPLLDGDQADEFRRITTEIRGAIFRNQEGD